MAMEDYEDFGAFRPTIVHIISEQEKNEYADKKIKKFGWGSRKQWRTVMMIEVNTHRRFHGTTYGDLHNFIAMYIEEGIEVSKSIEYEGGSLGGDFYEDDQYFEAMADAYYDQY